MLTPLLLLTLIPPPSLSLLPRKCSIYRSETQITFNCRGLGLTAVPEGSKSLQKLLLDENRLRHLPNNSFSSFPSLTSLNLRSNGLREISPLALSNLSFLRFLNLSKNALTLPSSWGPSALPSSLEILDLSDNPLGILPNRHLVALGRLKILRATNCQLRLLSPDALAGLVSLRVVDFVKNRLTSVPEANTATYLSLMRHLSKLSLGANAWQCDCDLLWLKRWLQERPFVSTRAVIHDAGAVLELEPVCSSPRSLLGKEIFSPRVTEAALSCPSAPKSSSGFYGLLSALESSEFILYASIGGAWLVALLTLCGVVCYCVLPAEKFKRREETPKSRAALLKVPANKQQEQQREEDRDNKQQQPQQRPSLPQQQQQREQQQHQQQQQEPQQLHYLLHHLPRAVQHSPHLHARHVPQVQLLAAQSPPTRMRVTTLTKTQQQQLEEVTRRHQQQQLSPLTRRHQQQQLQHQQQQLSPLTRRHQQHQLQQQRERQQQEQNEQQQLEQQRGPVTGSRAQQQQQQQPEQPASERRVGAVATKGHGPALVTLAQPPLPSPPEQPQQPPRQKHPQPEQRKTSLSPAEPNQAETATTEDEKLKEPTSPPPTAREQEDEQRKFTSIPNCSEKEEIDSSQH